MAAVVDPVSGLELYELSHPWGYYTPIMPGYEDIKLERVSHHARHGAMAQRFSTVMHTSTHLNAPIHLVQRAATVGNLPLDRFFGTGVVVSMPKQKWELVKADDLAAAKPAVRDGDIVLIVTGWHRHYSDSIRYFGHAPGLSKEAAEWLVARNAKLVGIDTGTIDHPLATSLGPHRNGPQIRFLLPEYRKATGRNAIDDFPDWNPAHRTLLQAGIPTIENVGGDVAEALGKRCTFHAYPWRWTEGDACVIRLVAMVDRGSAYRIEPGTAG
jgi:kynurenine formamidase